MNHEPGGAPAPLRTPLFVRGGGRAASVGREVTRLSGASSRVSLVADPVLARLGLLETIEASLTEAGHEFETVDGAHAEPSEALVGEIAQKISEQKADCVVVAGGGSTLDAGKLAATFAGDTGSIASYRLAAKALSDRTPRLIAIPTTAGTGSEATSVAIASDENGIKHWFWSDDLLPDLAILDGLMTLTLPRTMTLATGIDALVHALEAATSTKSTPASDEFATGAIGLIVDNLGNAAINPHNLEARQAMLDAASIAGIAINSAGTAMAHAIGHALGSTSAIHHGHAVALGMAASLDWAIEGEEVHFSAAADALGAATSSDLPRRFHAFLDETGFELALPPGFKDVSVEELAGRIGAPENAVMVGATRRAASPDDLKCLARATLDLGRAASF